MGFYTYNGGLIGVGDINAKSGVFDQKRAHSNPLGLSVADTTQVTSAGLAGLGTSAAAASSFSQTLSLSSTNYSAGKRLVIALFGYRDSGGAITNNRVPLISSASLGGTSLTIISQGHSDYNVSCIAAGLVDLTGSQSLSVNFITSISGGDGYSAFMIFDNVTAWDYIGDDADSSASTSSLSISGTAGIPSTIIDGQTVRIVGLNSSNSGVAPTFTPSDGFTYTSWFSQDNGTTEFSVGYYFIDSEITGQQNAISGSMGGTTASNGFGIAVADFKIYQ